MFTVWQEVNFCAVLTKFNLAFSLVYAHLDSGVLVGSHCTSGRSCKPPFRTRISLVSFVPSVCDVQLIPSCHVAISPASADTIN